jgi:hypothetical protein
MIIAFAGASILFLGFCGLYGCITAWDKLTGKERKWVKIKQ